jgi:hypothetical protein
MRSQSVSPTGASIAGVVAILALLSLALQYVLLVGNTRETIGVAAATVRYFSDFTILANLLVAGVALSAALRREATGFWAHATMRGGAAIYIGVTMVVYDRVLQPLWNPAGAQLWADLGLHYLVPLSYLTWWLWWAPHGGLRWSDLAKWLLFPLAFLAWTCVRGTWVHEWPYPFLDVDALGIATVLRNALGVLGVMLAVGLAVLGVDRGLSAPRAPQTP